MGLAELVLLAVGLSMDAFAVSICKGLGMKKINLKVAVVLGLFFGGFQAGMPVIGWALGSQFMGIIGPIDHWIAFILLAFIGGKMLWEALRASPITRLLPHLYETRCYHMSSQRSPVPNELPKRCSLIL